MYTDARVVYTYRGVNDTITVEELNEKLFVLHIPALVFVATSMVVGITGNSLVLIIYKRNYRRTSHRYFILFLAMIDLLACSTGLPFLIASLRFPYLMTSNIACKVLRYFHYMANNSSGLLLVIISIERYRKICRPFKTQWTPRQILYWCIITVLVSAIIAVPSGIFFGKSVIETKIGNITGYECYIDEHFKGTHVMEIYMEALMGETVVCIILFIVLYVLIIRKVRQSDQFINAIRSMRSLKIKSYHKANIHDTSLSTDALDDGGDNFVGSRNIPTRNSSIEELDGQTFRKGSSASTTMTSLYSVQPGSRNLLNQVEDKESQPKSPGAQQKSGKLMNTLPIKLKLSQVVNGSNRNLDDTKRGNKAKSLPSSRRPVLDRLIMKPNVSTRSDVVHRTGHSSKATIRVTVMLFTVSLVFALAFIPHLTLMVLTMAKKDFLASLNPTEVQVYQFFLRIFIINNIANPIIYVFCDKKFRTGCYRLLCRCCKRAD